MKKFIKAISAIAVCLSLASCNAWLDDYEDTSNLYDTQAWSSEQTADLYINGFYTYISKYSPFGDQQFGGSLTESLTDSFKYGSQALGHKAGHPNNYVTTPEAISTAGCLYGIWSEAYTQIRRINGFLTSMKKYSKFSAEKNTELEAQARFFRAFVYFQLAKRHPQGVIMLDHLLETNDIARSSAEEMWEFIYQDIKFAVDNLPEEWNATNKGRVTKYAALALMSRAMLYAERWQDAYDAAELIIASGKFGLVDDYAQSWKGGNKESILEFNYNVNGPAHNFDQDNVPNCDGYEYGSLGTPTQEMVECYEKADGSEFDWSAWHAGSSTRPYYETLEPRFQATVIYNGCDWKGKTMECAVGTENGTWMDYGSESYSYGKTTTGYYLRKLVDESHTDLKGVKSTQTWVEFRYAEVLLNRAEAAYRLGNTDYQNTMNDVRARVGLPKKNTTGETWFNDYRRERKVELSYEGHLFWDLRRWKVAHIELSNYRVHGLKIVGSTFNYVECDIADRLFYQRLYCLPIPDAEINNNNLIEQYPEWL